MPKASKLILSDKYPGMKILESVANSGKKQYTSGEIINILVAEVKDFSESSTYNQCFRALMKKGDRYRPTVLPASISKVCENRKETGLWNYRPLKSIDEAVAELEKKDTIYSAEKAYDLIEKVNVAALNDKDFRDCLTAVSVRY